MNSVTAARLPSSGMINGQELTLPLAVAHGGETMQFCRDGHEIPPGDKFCATCGGEPFTACDQCGAAFRPADDELRPEYCPKCGKDYPWI